MNLPVNTSLHPFFTKSHNAERPICDRPVDAEINDGDSEEKVQLQSAVTKTRRKKKLQANQKTLEDILEPRVGVTEKGDEGEDVSDDLEQNRPPRKRRRTASIDQTQQKETPVAPAPSTPQNDTVISAVQDDVISQTPPKKVLRLRANGTFSSPPTKQPAKVEEIEQPTTPKRRGRPRKSQARNVAVQLLVKISYGEAIERRRQIAERVEEILNKPPNPKPKTTPKRTPRKSTKPTHPFFNGKPRTEAVTAVGPTAPSPRKASAITPGKLRFKVPADRADDAADHSAPFISALLRDMFMPRIPGAREAPWPQRAEAHVRALSDLDWVDDTAVKQFREQFHVRRHKEGKPILSPNESILVRHASRLQPASEPASRPDGFRNPHSSVRLPARSLINGVEIAARVQEHLIINLLVDELASSSQSKPAHPALQTLNKRISTTLSAFDEIKGEPQMWTQKYAPSCAAEVLQSQSEVTVLKDWLKSLAVHRVNDGVLVSKTLAGPSTLKPKRKRKKKPKDLEDFLIDSDEDIRDMSELDGDVTEDDAGLRGSQKSIVQMVSNGTRLSNAILLSGPHGSGKSAAVYAVAQELGFKVFEISSSERRSGKDILDKVGNMTENHQVKHFHDDVFPPPPPVSQESDHIEEAFQRDLESGRQGSLNSFFKPKPNTAAKSKSTTVRPVPVKAKAKEIVQALMKKPPREQQQSLILLEEADILFADDKDFWSTVFRLIISSKRPCIMTCNDEQAVPQQAMTLHAVLRFRQAPAALATDYLQLLAAAEGHILPRSAVEALYQSKKCDLRASITELSFWCQMGVGDPRGGLGWILQRYPPGSDLDEQGRLLRVVSTDTYQYGMGLLMEDDHDASHWLSSTWSEFSWHPLDTIASENIASAHDIPTADQFAALQQLKNISSFYDALSAAELYNNASTSLDPSQPDLPDKYRAQYTLAEPLLQTDESIDYTNLTQELLCTTLTTAIHTYHPQAETYLNTLKTTTLTNPPSSLQPLTRADFTSLDPLALPLQSTNPISTIGLIRSTFDDPMPVLICDLAPYVRTILSYDQALEEQRQRLTSLLDTTPTGTPNSTGEVPRAVKRGRTTRAARSALEGGMRATTRREKWWDVEIDVGRVLRTGGMGWVRSVGGTAGSIGSGGGETVMGGLMGGDGEVGQGGIRPEDEGVLAPVTKLEEVEGGENVVVDGT